MSSYLVFESCVDVILCRCSDSNWSYQLHSSQQQLADVCYPIDYVTITFIYVYYPCDVDVVKWVANAVSKPVLA